MMGDERLAPPVLLRDEREEAVFDLVPLARARRQVTHGDREPEFVHQSLQLELPEPQAIAVAAAPIGCDDERGGVRIPGRAHFVPPWQFLSKWSFYVVTSHDYGRLFVSQSSGAEVWVREESTLRDLDIALRAHAIELIDASAPSKS
jgi:hypothetical protein